eukprot:PhM_4_TR7808/c0_g1_i1/m.69721/K12175/GPS1, COPS1, CSN1; COP9 signalosome complex subunit 1
MSSFFSGSGASGLQSYIDAYAGPLKLHRVSTIALTAPSEDVRAAARSIALSLLKQGNNIVAYKNFITKFTEAGVKDLAIDDTWVKQTEQTNHKRMESLEAELHTAKANVLVKDNIRIALIALAAFMHSAGDLTGAIRNYARVFDYCTTPKQMVEVSLAMAEVSLENNNYAYVSQCLDKAEQRIDPRTDKAEVGKLKLMQALVLLEQKRFKTVAKKLLQEVRPEALDAWLSVLTPTDIVATATLCALATFDRAEVRKYLIDPPQVKVLLEAVPELRTMIADFYESKYTTCLRTLATVKDAMLNDLFLRPHVAVLQDMVRQRALRQYVAPYSKVDLSRMAEAFNTTVGDLEKELASAIADGVIVARLDKANKVLFAAQANERATAYQQAIDAGKAYVQETENHIRRLHMARYDFVARPPRSMMTGGAPPQQTGVASSAV